MQYCYPLPLRLLLRTATTTNTTTTPLHYHCGRHYHGYYLLLLLLLLRLLLLLHTINSWHVRYKIGNSWTQSPLVVGESGLWWRSDPEPTPTIHYYPPLQTCKSLACCSVTSSDSFALFRSSAFSFSNSWEWKQIQSSCHVLRWHYLITVYQKLAWDDVLFCWHSADVFLQVVHDCCILIHGPVLTRQNSKEKNETSSLHVSLQRVNLFFAFALQALLHGGMTAFWCIN